MPGGHGNTSAGGIRLSTKRGEKREHEGRTRQQEVKLFDRSTFELSMHRRHGDAIDTNNLLDTTVVGMR